MITAAFPWHVFAPEPPSPLASRIPADSRTAPGGWDPGVRDEMLDSATRPSKSKSTGSHRRPMAQARHVAPADRSRRCPQARHAGAGGRPNALVANGGLTAQGGGLSRAASSPIRRQLAVELGFSVQCPPGVPHPANNNAAQKARPSLRGTASKSAASRDAFVRGLPMRRASGWP